MPAREHILHRVRTALGRNTDQEPAPAPPARLRVGAMEPEERTRLLLERFPGTAVCAGSAEEARSHVARLLNGGRAAASPSAFLQRLGILDLPGVTAVSGDPAQVRQTCATADAGITSAAYAMADTGALVMLASAEEPRLVSLLPLVHITVLPSGCILTGLDELFTVLPDPAEVSSSMVLIGGPSKTADIEQILTLGVHGPRELHLVLVDLA